MSLASLRRFARATPPAERCGCGAALPARHEHVLAGEGVECACAGCASAGRRVPPRLERLDALPEPLWAALDVPIGLCWVTVRAGVPGAQASWPSPAGPVGAPIDAGTWEQAVAASPALAGLRPDVEALLVHRLGEAREQWVVSIDRCWTLAGVVRRAWRGLSGGQELKEAVETFLAELRAGDA